MSTIEDGAAVRPLQIHSAICRGGKDHISIRGQDLVQDLMGKISLADMFYLELNGRLPTDAQSRLLDAMMVSVVEHGFMPSTIAARMTDYGSPDSLQSSVAAGLLGAGTRILGSMERCAQMLSEANPAGHGDLPALARDIVDDYQRRKADIPGLGHPIHKPHDPRAQKLFAMARELDQSGPAIALLHEISKAANKALERELTVNVTAAIAAVGLDIGVEWRAIKGISLVARTVGIVAHVMEEKKSPTAWEITRYASAVGER